MTSGISGAGARMPWEAVRDWFHIAGNYVDPLDRAAEALAEQLGPEEAALIARLADHGITIVTTADEAAPLRSLDRPHGTLDAQRRDAARKPPLPDRPPARRDRVRR